NSFLLARFLSETLVASGQELHKLNCGAFFAGDNSPSAQYIAWCRSGEAGREKDIRDGLEQLCRHSVFQGAPVGRLLDASADGLAVAAGRWLQEYEHLLEEEAELSKHGGAQNPAL